LLLPAQLSFHTSNKKILVEKHTMFLPPEFAVAPGLVGQSLAAGSQGEPSKGNSATQPHLAAPALNLIFEQLAYGVLVVNTGGKILHANQSARSELQSSPWLGRNGTQIEATLPQEHTALQDALASAQCGQRSVLHFGAGAQPLTLAVVPMLAQGQVQCELIALLFARPMVCDTLMLHHFARSHKLTPMEECVLRLLCQEMDQAEMAKELSVAVSTVRTHMKNIATKTGCHGMRALLARLALLPPLMPQVLSDSAIFEPPAMH
jgi:DNA-binding CsgD family transcriptional regulator